ncbi:hypothetical protein [Pinibacter soli]|uniref:Uncharacterized protein n=1 Tax=Pinibacter soli TaxID=3044211 RepID=A0ABT6RCZ4_9BACT|nr:hypothetical protein [Pinibacter soli]MDI3320383.1 hypothetical protein [Pinibacter soli]
MRTLYSSMLATVVCALLTTGCQKDYKSDEAAQPAQSNSAAKTKTTTPADVAATLAKLRATLPANFESRSNSIKADLLAKVNPEYKYTVLNALKLTETTCDDNTLVTQWLNLQLADWSYEIIFYASLTGMLDFPTYDALLFENTESGQQFGINGEYSHRITKTMKDLKRFWDIQSSQIIVVPMHGSMLQNRDKVIRIDMILYGDSEIGAEYWADVIAELLQGIPQYRNGNHPIFTFNAFAQGSFDFPPFGVVPDKIVMGDGILDSYAAIGYGDVAPQAILAHEFGHHVQFQRGVFGNVSSPEATRRTELMADAMSAYFLSSARGASMQWKRVKEFLQVFFNIGDCSFTSINHHGTPTQRMAAAEFGYQTANNAQKQGHIMSANDFIALFDAALPGIVSQ